jgi:pyruvate/2-oxoacid:ferredoxin oxidoreductase alpha subunit
MKREQNGANQAGGTSSTYTSKLGFLLASSFSSMFLRPFTWVWVSFSCLPF